MAATISATGTWTPLTFDATAAGKTQENAPRLDDWQTTNFAGEVDSELNQFIQLVADAYAIGFQPARVLVFYALKRQLHSESPTIAAHNYTP